MLFMEIYRSLGNANVINIYLQHVLKWPRCPRSAFKIKFLHFLGEKKKQNVEWYRICFAERSTMMIFGRIVCHISGGFLYPPSLLLSKYLSLCVCPQMKARRLERRFCPTEVSLSKMWTVPRINQAEIYLMHPHRVLLKSILGCEACQALSLVIYACYSLRERVHRPSLCRDHMDHTQTLNMKISQAGSTFIVFTERLVSLPCLLSHVCTACLNIWCPRKWLWYSADKILHMHMPWEAPI